MTPALASYVAALDEKVVEKAAQAAYEADAGPHMQAWINLPDKIRLLWISSAKASILAFLEAVVESGDAKLAAATTKWNKLEGRWLALEGGHHESFPQFPALILRLRSTTDG